MTELEQRLRAEFEGQASSAPAPVATERFALTLLGSRRHRRLRWLIPAVAALVLIVPILTVVLAHRHKSTQPADPSALVGIRWLLVRSVAADGTAKAGPVGRLQQVLQFDGSGGITFDLACNAASGRVTVTADQLNAVSVMVTSAGCGPQWDEAMGLLDSNQALHWRVVDRTLTITGHDGRKLIFQVAPSIYPLDYPGSPNVTVTTGQLGTGDYRVSFVKNSKNQIYLFLEFRLGPGSPWSQYNLAGRIGWTGPQPDAAHGACSTAPAGQGNYLYGLATADAARVAVHDDSTGVDRNAALFPLPGTGGLQAYLGLLGTTGRGATLSIRDSADRLLGSPCTLR